MKKIEFWAPIVDAVSRAFKTIELRLRKSRPSEANDKPSTELAAPNSTSVKLIEINGLRVLAKRYKVKKSFRASANFAQPPKEWRPRQYLELNDQLPQPWPTKYIDDYKQPFSPNGFYTNMAMLCNYSSESKTDKEIALSIVNSLTDRLLQYTDTEGEKSYVRYDFAFGRPEGFALSPPWYSAIANGFAIRGLILAFEKTNDQKFLDLAVSYGEALKEISGRNYDKKSVTVVDTYGFLWLDEYPSPERGPSFVLNGHIHAIFGLFDLCRHYHDEEIRSMLDASLTTVQQLGHLFRRDDKINRYELRAWKKADYLPPRTVRQQKELFRLTGEKYFLELSKAFEKDIAANSNQDT